MAFSGRWNNDFVFAVRAMVVQRSHYWLALDLVPLHTRVPLSNEDSDNVGECRNGRTDGWAVVSLSVRYVFVFSLVCSFTSVTYQVFILLPVYGMINYSDVFFSCCRHRSLRVIRLSLPCTHVPARAHTHTHTHRHARTEVGK